MIEVFNLKKTFEERKGKVIALNDVSFTIPDGELFTLLGPSGCGKSTMLRCVGGLEKPDAGVITIGGEVVFSSKDRIFVPPHKRDVGMVFQSYAIWPHMTVFKNVAYPLTIQKLPKKEIRERVALTLRTVGLEGLEDRLAPQLSGGQQQRVALARALVKAPEILLLDEPLSNLDAKLREQMRREIKELHQKLKITTLYVTHDQIEALAISDLVAVMNQGNILEIGSPKDIYHYPKDKFTADFLGLTNILEGKVIECTENRGKADTPMGELSCSLPSEVKKGDEIQIIIRAENIFISKEKPPASQNAFEGKISSLVFLGEFIDCEVCIKGRILRARLHPSSPFREKESIHLGIEPDSIICVPA